MKNFKKIIAIALMLCMMAAITSCGNNTSNSDSDKEESKTITIAYQYGMAYAPLQIMMEKKLIEKNYDGDVKVNWTQLNSGSAINEGIAGGTVDVGCMGIGPFISGVVGGIPYKMYSALSSQTPGLMTNNSAITSLKDVKDTDKIALVNIGSFQHIILAMAAKKELGDAHALDGNISAMAHPDGKTALENGTVSLQLTAAPYLNQEKNNSKLHEVSLGNVWPDGNTFIVGVASTNLYEKNKDLYDALVNATNEAIDYINNNKKEVASLICENDGVDVKTMLSYLNDSSCQYDTKAKGIMELAKFMADNEFIDKAPESFDSIVFDNVSGN